MVDLHKEGFNNNEYNINGLKVYELAVNYSLQGASMVQTSVNLPMSCPLGVVGCRIQGGSSTWITVADASISLHDSWFGTPVLRFSYNSTHTGNGTITFYVLYYDRGDYDADFKTDASDFS